jgi:hypothetical protein
MLKLNHELRTGNERINYIIRVEVGKEAAVQTLLYRTATATYSYSLRII